MDNRKFSRRFLLRAAGGTLGISWLSIDWADVAAAASGAAQASFLTATERADIEAISAQIIPTDDTPGAREAGVVDFIDRGLATFFAPIAKDFRAGLAEFQRRCRGRHPGQASFAALSPEQQIELLTEVERTPFFSQARLLTVLGMFSLPSYGGNKDGTGWKLLGFEDRHVFEPPFGHYDRVHE